MGKGMVQRITGPVVDILFESNEVPDIFNAITVDVKGMTSTLEVSQHLGNGEVRCISMSPTDGFFPGNGSGRHRRPHSGQCWC